MKVHFPASLKKFHFSVSLLSDFPKENNFSVTNRNLINPKTFNYGFVFIVVSQLKYENEREVKPEPGTRRKTC